MLRKITNIGIGLLFLPFCLGFTWQLGAGIFSTPYKPDLPYYFLAGGLAYLTLHLFFTKPILAYVFGHELTHALFAMLFGGSIKSFRASGRGGQVVVTKSNFIITLAPYFFPLYTCIAVLLYFLASGSDMRGAAALFIFFTGVTFSFHIILTLVFLRADQKDIREHGSVFSYPVIYLFNIFFAAVLVHVLLAKDSRFLDFLKNGIITSLRIVFLFFERIYALAA